VRTVVTLVPRAAAYRSGVAQRPYVLLSAAKSADGYIDDAGGQLRSLTPSGVLFGLGFSAIGNDEM
jgi:hypothetical protein